MKLRMVALLLGVIAVGAAGCRHHSGTVTCVAQYDQEPSRKGAATAKSPDLSGRARFGVASFYARMFAHRKMANGARMNPQGDNAASKTRS